MSQLPIPPPPSGPPVPRGPGGPIALPLDGDRRRYVAAAWHHKRIVVGVTLVGTIAGLLVARLLSPWFEAQGLVWTRVADRSAPLREGSGVLLSSSGWVDLLHSDSVLDPVVRELRLYLSASAADSDAFASFDVKADFRSGRYRLTVDNAGYRVALSDLDSGAMRRSAVGDSVGADLGFAWVPPAAALKPGRKIEFALTSVHSVTHGLAQALRAEADESGNFIRVALRGSNPARITRTVNGVLDHLVVVAADLKRQRLTENSKALGEWAAQARADLESAQQAMKEFQARTADVMALRSNRDSLRRDREAINRILVQASDSGLAVDALGTIGAVQRSPNLSSALREMATKQAQLRALRLRYTDQAPAVQRVLRDVETIERHTIPGLARSLMAELERGEADATRRMGSALGSLRQLPSLTAEETRLEGEVTDAQQRFNSVEQRYEGNQLAEASGVADVRVLDRASVPDEPVLNPGPFFVLLALLGSFGVSVVGAVVLDRFKPKLRSHTQVTHGLGLAVLGAVPRADLDKRRSSEDAAQVIEAMHAIRLNLRHAYGAAGPVLVTVTSPGKGDGKSFVASNLALAFAGVGHRTLLIDGDVRRGELDRVLELPRGPGLTDALVAVAPAERVVQATKFPHLSFIACGQRVANAAIHLSGSRMPALLAGLRPEFDVILVDSPPLAAGVDAYVLGTVTGNMMLVFRTGVSDEDLARARLEVVERLPVRILGAVLNDVQPGDWHRYYSRDLGGYELPEGAEPGDVEPTILRGAR
jgi:capsular exopolysaccharide synthesis family protein